MINTIISFSIYLLFAFILLFRFKYIQSDNVANTLNRFNALRGLFALEVVIGHCVRYQSGILSPFGNFMLVSVGFFFFISGMGLTLSFQTKDNYLNTFIKRRFFKLVYIAIFALIFTTIIAYVSPIKTDFANIPTSVKSFVAAIFVRTNWYIRELLLLYLLFFMTFKFIRKYQCAFLSFICVIASVVLFSLGYTRCWYASILCFPLGVIVCQYYNQITAFLSSLAGKCIIFVALGIGLLSSILNNHLNQSTMPFAVTEFIFSIGNNILCLGFIALLLIILSNFSFNNIMLRFFARYSTELFVFQFIFIEISQKMQLSYNMKIAFVVSLDLIVSLMLHHLFLKTQNLLTR